jgi:hypothetical protein
MMSAVHTATRHHDFTEAEDRRIDSLSDLAAMLM